MPPKIPPAREQFAAAVLSIRENKHLSGDAVAAAAGISRNTFYLIENKAANVQIDTLCRVAIALDVDPREFFSDKKYPSPSPARVASLRRTVAENIRRHRVELELSQSELTRQLTMARNYIGHIERDAPDLSLNVLERIANHLKVSIEELLDTGNAGRPPRRQASD